MRKRKVLIIDDERPAVEVLEKMVGRRSDLEMVLATTDYYKARDCLDEHEIDIAFIDLKLRVGSGYDLMGNVEPPTQIIVCTGSNDQGTESILAGAIDYLVKPVIPERFDFAVDRATRQMELLELESAHKVYPGNIMVQLVPDKDNADIALQNPDANHYLSFKVNKLVFAKPEEKNTRLFLKNGSEMLIKMLLRDLQAKLDPNQYIRIQRGYLVKRSIIKLYAPGSEYHTKHWWIFLEDQCVKQWKNDLDHGKFPVGEIYRNRLEKLLGIR